MNQKKTDYIQNQFFFIELDLNYLMLLYSFGDRPV